MKPKLSIIVPVYNVEQWIDECLKSIQKQVFKEWECILVNDGSSDGSGMICEVYAKNDNRFRVYHQKNSGVSAARNIGIELSQAEHISFIDPDDFIADNFYSAMMTCAYKNEVQCVAAQTRMIDTNAEDSIMSGFVNLGRIAERQLFTSNKEILCGIDSLITGGPWGYVFDRKLWDNIKFPVGIDLAEDVAVIPIVIARCQRAEYIPEAKYYHRIRQNSLLSQPLSEERYIKSLQATSMMYNISISEHPETPLPFLKMKISSDLFRFLDYLKTHSDIKGSRLLHLYQLVKKAENQKG